MRRRRDWNELRGYLADDHVTDRLDMTQRSIPYCDRRARLGARFVTAHTIVPGTDNEAWWEPPRPRSKYAA